MNPLIIFDHIFFRIAFIFSNIFDFEEQKELSGAAIVSLLQFMNVITVVNVIKPLGGFKKFDPAFIFAAIYLVLIILNLIRYYKFVTYTKLEDKRIQERRSTKSKRKVYITCYLALTLFLFIYSSFYAKMR